MQITQIENEINRIDGIKFEEMIQSLISNYYYFEDGFMIYETGKIPGSQQPSKSQIDIWFSYKINDVVQYFFVAVTKQKNNVFCKNGKAEKDIKDLICEVKKTNFSNVTIIFACNQNPSPEEYSSLLELCAKERLRFEMWGLNKIASLLQHNSKAAADYLGLVDDSTSLIPFSEYYSKCSRDSLLAKDFLFRDEEKDFIVKKVLESTKPVTIVHGPSGCGKTRLAIEASKELQNIYGFLCYFFKPINIDIATNILSSIPENKKAVLIIDDANTYHYLNLFIETIISKPNVSVLMTLRDYLWDDFSKKIDFLYYDLSLSPLKKTEIEKVVKMIYGVTNKKYLDYLYAISRNNLRFALMTTDVFVQKKEKACSISDVLENYYGAILKDSGIDKDENLEKIIVAVSLLGRTDIRDINNNSRICKIFNIPPDKFIQSCYEAEAKEFVSIFKNAVVEITDQVLAEYLIYKYVFLYKIVSLIDVFNLLYKYNQSKIVWFFNALLGIYEFNEVIRNELETLKDYCANCKSEDKSFAFFQLFGSLFPEECIDFAYRRSFINDEFAQKDYFKLIFRFAHNEKTYKRVVSCFMCLIDNKTTSKSVKEFIVENIKITIDSLDNKFAFEKEFLLQLTKLAYENIDAQNCLHEILKIYFPYETNYTEYENETKQVFFKRFIIPYSQEYIEFRLLMWSGLNALLNNKQFKFAKDVLSCNRTTISEEDPKIRQFDKEQAVLLFKTLDTKKSEYLVFAFSLLSPYKRFSEIKEIFSELRKDKYVNLFYTYVYERTSLNIYGDELEKSFKKNYLEKYSDGDELVNELATFYNLFSKEHSWKVGHLILYSFNYLADISNEDYDCLVMKFILAVNACFCFNPHDMLFRLNNKKTFLNWLFSKNIIEEVIISQLLITMRIDEIDEEIYEYALCFYKNIKDITYGNDNILSLKNFESYRTGFFHEIISQFSIDKSNYHFLEHVFLNDDNIENNVLNIFNDDFQLFRKIYFGVSKYSQLCDLEGEYLKFLISKVPEALNDFFALLFNGQIRAEIRGWLFELPGFVEAFVNFIDNAKYVSLNFYIGHLVSKMPDDVLVSFIDFYVSVHKNNPYKMQTLSIILFQREKSGTQTILFKVLMKNKIPEAILQKMDLFNGPHSWSGSVVPYIHDNIKEMTALINSGDISEPYVSYLKKLISNQEKRSKEEEIAEFNRDDY